MTLEWIEEYPKAVEMALNLWFQESILSAQYHKMFKNEPISTWIFWNIGS